ncbi:MAG: histone H1 [Lysobacter sp.]|nr:MAG: histone H1 [Lysobacter sp.]
MAKTPKRPRDPNQLAKLIADIATGEVTEPKTDDGKDPAAVALGRKGGLKGGKARAASLTAEARAEIAKKAASKRWESRKQQQAIDSEE